MLTLSGNLLNKPVMSLRTGGVVATATRPLINPNNLKIEGFYCSARNKKQTTILLTQDIRDIIRRGFVVNDLEVLTEPDDLVRLKETLSIDFQLKGKTVVTDSKHKIGKIGDWAAETTTFFIRKLYVERSMLKSFSQGQLSVDRSQIVEITDKQIIIQDILKPEKSGVPAAAQAA